MSGIRRTVPRRAAAAGAALLLSAFAGFGAGPDEAKRPPGDLPDAELMRLLAPPVEALGALTADAKDFRAKARRAQNEASCLAVYAQVGAAGRDEATARRLAALRDAAVAVAEAARGGDAAAARREAARLAAFREPGAKLPEARAEVPLRSLIARATLMEQVGLLRLELGQDDEETARDWEAKGARDARVRAAWKLAALARVVAPHAPEQEKAGEPKRTRQFWLDCAAETEEATRLLPAAAAGSRPPAFAAALKKVDAACQKCHDVFRTE